MRSLRSVPILAFFLSVVVVAACGDDSPTSPTPVEPPQPQFPQVAGTYTGPVRITGSHITGSLDGHAEMTVQQAGNQLTVWATFTFPSQTVEVPSWTGTIDMTGNFTGTPSGRGAPVNDPTCGSLRTIDISLTFILNNNSARFAQRVDTDWCGIFNYSGTWTAGRVSHRWSGGQQ